MKFTIQDFRKRFPNDDACLDEIMRLRFHNISECPSCKKATKFYRVKERRCYACSWCAHQIYPTKGTPFEKSPTPLSSWFYVMYLMTATRSGVSAKEVERQLGVTYKCAWRMCHEIRKLMAQKVTDEKLKGHVEIDETYIGGIQKGKRGRGAAGKSAVVGMVEREGDVRAFVIPDTKSTTLMPLVEDHIEKGSTVSSDLWRSYRGLKTDYLHGTVNHSQKEYVNEEHHTQAIEGFWSHLKRSISGTHIWVSKKHLQKYIGEFIFRYNLRKDPTSMFDWMLWNLSQPKLEGR